MANTFRGKACNTEILYRSNTASSTGIEVGEMHVH